MNILGLSILDLVVIFFYFVIIVYIGYRAMTKVHTQEDYFLGGRRFNRFFQTFSNFGQATSSESVVHTVSIVAVNGVAGSMQQALSNVFTYPINWLFPKWLRRSRLMSMGGFFVERFNSHKLGTLYALAQTILFLMVGGMGLYATSSTILAVTEKPKEVLSAEELVEYEQAERLAYLARQPSDLLTQDEREELSYLRELRPSRQFSYLNRTYLILVLATFVALYAMAGGYAAAVYSDTMQGMFIITLTILLIPFAMFQLNLLHGETGPLGAFRVMTQVLPDTMFEVFAASPAWVEFTWYNIIILGIMGMAGNISFSNNLVVAGGARTDKVASWGGLSGLLTRGTASLIWVLLALLILTLFGMQTGNPDLLFGQAVRELLPVGLVGLMLACLLAAAMSTADTHMMTVSGLVTHHMYKPFRPNCEDRHYLLVGRCMTMVYIVGAILFALNSDNLFRMWKYMVLINLCTGPAILMGFLWRRTNVAAVWSSMGITLLLTLFIPAIVMIWPGARYNESLLLEAETPRVERTYVASEMDVMEREERIRQWELLDAKGEAQTRRPESLEVGEPFVQTIDPISRSIFWDGGIRRDADDRRHGHGFFKVELYLMHVAGVDLTRMAPSRIEMISLMFRLVFPFLAVILVGWLTRPEKSSRLNYFYAKQRTPVNPDPEKDRAAVAAALKDADSPTLEPKLWPQSNWEFTPLSSYDRKGLSYALGAGLLLVLLTFLLGRIGFIGS